MFYYIRNWTLSGGKNKKIIDVKYTLHIRTISEMNIEFLQYLQVIVVRFANSNENRFFRPVI